VSKTVVVTTTIRIPNFLQDLCQNVRRNKRDDVSFIVIGDVKTPLEIRQFCRKLSDEFSLDIDYFDINGQKKSLNQYQPLLELMPLNSGSRKMIGNFLAYQEGCDRLIMIDDDNFIIEDDFFGLYDVVGRKENMKLMESDSGWYNVYESVIERHNIPFYPRGYPWSERFPKIAKIREETLSLPVVVKNGLVLEDPDIDAVSRLFWPIRVTAMKPEFQPHFGLHPGTWTSFNNQNTAISREVIPVYFTPPSTGRNADIWTSYVICCLCGRMQSVVSFGRPLVRQDRNPHDLWRDLDDEALNNRATDRFVALLRSVTLTKTTYSEAMDELIQQSLDKLSSWQDVPQDQREMIEIFFREYRTWHELFLNSKGY